MNRQHAGETFGQYVRRVRRAAGLSQVELAKRIEVSDSMISAIEHDHRIPSARSGLALCVELELDSDALPREPDVQPLPSAPGGIVLLSWK